MRARAAAAGVAVGGALLLGGCSATGIVDVHADLTADIDVTVVTTLSDRVSSCQRLFDGLDGVTVEERGAEDERVCRATGTVRRITGWEGEDPVLSLRRVAGDRIELTRRMGSMPWPFQVAPGAVDLTIAFPGAVEGAQGASFTGATARVTDRDLADGTFWIVARDSADDAPIVRWAGLGFVAGAAASGLVGGLALARARRSQAQQSDAQAPPPDGVPAPTPPEPEPEPEDPSVWAPEEP